MSRRHFLTHLAGASAAMTIPALTLGHSIRLHADDLKRRRKSAIMLWMSGGPSTIDIWDLKPGAPTGGPFMPIATSGDVQISQHMPLTAQQMHHMAIIRSMSTREADHGRGRYYMHTGYAPNPNIEHPSYGSVLAHELNDQRPELEIPPFVAVGGGSVGPGFLGMAWAPFTVDSNGRIRNLDMGLDQVRDDRARDYQQARDREVRARPAQDHGDVPEQDRERAGGARHTRARVRLRHRDDCGNGRAQRRVREHRPAARVQEAFHGGGRCSGCAHESDSGVAAPRPRNRAELTRRRHVQVTVRTRNGSTA